MGSEFFGAGWKSEAPLDGVAVTFAGDMFFKNVVRFLGKPLTGDGLYISVTVTKVNFLLYIF